MDKFRPLVIALLLAGLTLVVFSPVRNHDFVWDDRVNLTDNPHLKSPNFSHLLTFWRQPYEGLYVPLTYTLWGIVARFASLASVDQGQTQLAPFLFHAANLILHLLSVLVVFAILKPLVGKDWAAAAGACLFAVHPVQVEPVAWVTGMKDLLSGLLSLLAVWLYLKYARARVASRVDPAKSLKDAGKKSEARNDQYPRLHYALGTVAFVLALLAKPSAVVVPLIAGVLDYWMLRRPLRQCVLALAGWAVLAAPFVLLTKLEQPSVGMAFVPPYWARPLVAGDAVAFYLYKLLVPVWLGPDYGRTPEFLLRQGWTYAAWILPLGLIALVWWWRERWPWQVACAGVFLAGILPVLGLVPFEFQRFSTVADRYLYLSMLGPALALAYLLSRSPKSWFSGCSVLILGALSVGAAFQTQVWRDSTTLFAHALRINPSSSMAHNNLGGAVALQGLADEAVKHYHEALRLKPDYADPHNNLAVILLARGEVEEAIEHYREALRMDPYHTEAHYNLGNALARKGELEEAIVHFREALRLTPTYVMAHNNLANALVRRGELGEAVEHYRSAVRMEPNFAGAHYNLGSVLARKGELDGAVSHFREAVRLRPEFAQAHERLGRALALLGKREEAIEHMEKAVAILRSRTKEEGQGEWPSNLR